jgi:FkbM family methyltransferase
MAKVTHSTVLFEVNKHDCRYPFRLRIPSSDIPVFKQIFIDHAYDFRVETQPEVIVDAGANIGLASIYFANRYPYAKIIAVEPEQSNYELLEDNTAPYPNIIPVQAALWNTNEEINLVDPGLGKWGYMTALKESPENPPGKPCHTVMAMTMDRIMKNFGLEKSRSSEDGY